MNGDLGSFSMVELFRVEVENQAQVLTGALLELERDSAAAEPINTAMRAAHSLKGAARIIGLNAGVDTAHAMEDCLDAARQGRLALQQGHIDLLLRGLDLLTRMSQTPEAEIERWSGADRPAIEAFLADLARGPVPTTPAPTPSPTTTPVAVAPVVVAGDEAAPAQQPPNADKNAAERTDRALRVTAENLNRLLALTGESLVESRWLKPFANSLLRLSRMQTEIGHDLDRLRATLVSQAPNHPALLAHAGIQRRLTECHEFLAQRLAELEVFDRRSGNLAQRLYDGALAARMQPFNDGIKGFPRMVRDIARRLDKQARLQVVGEFTQVDRDILEKLEAPIGHLLRNALDHGLESPAERLAAGKPAEGVIRLEAQHQAGMLVISVADDGKGIDVERIRAAVLSRQLTDDASAKKLSETELLEFLYLPGFTLKETVTDISGRGVGLDVVHAMVKAVRGTLRTTTVPGHGTRFVLQLPLTLSVIRTLLADIGGEPYAFPLAHIVRTLKLPRDKIHQLEGRQHFTLDDRPTGLVLATQVFAAKEIKTAGDLSVLVLGGAGESYGLVVDRFLGEREMVVQPLDPRLGKIKDIAAGALMEDGAPVLIVDVEDVLRSIEKIVSHAQLAQAGDTNAAEAAIRRKRVLIVDDSLTVREVERKLLAGRGYIVEAAVDGMDGWNAVRTGHFDLVISDIDMPRMDGIELVTLIKKDPALKSVPVMIVSYKEREEDRRRGLEAGADYYLTKGSFRDEKLLEAVTDLIGKAQG